jgi:membrane-bound lytic murein transglycosylase B
LIRAIATFILLFIAAALLPDDAMAHHVRHAQERPIDPRDVAFDRFVTDFRATALAQGISPAVYGVAMSGIHRNQQVETLNQEQPEFVRPIWSYLDSATSPLRVATGQRMASEQAAVLSVIEAKFGVPREILLSIWGNETNYGTNIGSFNLFEALSTLAYDGARTDFAKRELLAALEMTQQEHLDPKQMNASWAGAFGQLQMLPSTFLKSAVDGDGDGKRDLWHSIPDALASAASELASDDWQRGSGWGYEVRLPTDFPYELADGETLKPIAEWTKLGVRAADGTPLPANTEPGSIYIPAGRRGPGFMTFANFKVILKYNNAVSYALAVCVLGDLIAGRSGIQGSWPRDEQPLSRDERIAFQTALAKLGFDPGKIDGVLGRGVKAALRQYQRAHGAPADGFPTLGLLQLILIEVAQKRL